MTKKKLVTDDKIKESISILDPNNILKEFLREFKVKPISKDVYSKNNLLQIAKELDRVAKNTQDLFKIFLKRYPNLDKDESICRFSICTCEGHPGYVSCIIHFHSEGKYDDASYTQSTIEDNDLFKLLNIDPVFVSLLRQKDILGKQWEQCN